MGWKKTKKTNKQKKQSIRLHTATHCCTRHLNPSICRGCKYDVVLPFMRIIWYTAAVCRMVMDLEIDIVKSSCLQSVVVSKGVGTSNESRTGANGIPYKLYNWVPATTSSAPNVSRTLRSWVAIQSVELTPDAIVVLLTIGQQSYIL